MYDQEKILSFARDEMVTNAESVECLLDFSKGPDAMMVTAMRKPDFAPSAHSAGYRVLEVGCRKSSPPSATPPAESATLPSPHPMPTTPRITSVFSIPTTNPATQPTITTKTPKPRAICSFCGKPFAHLGDHNKHRRRHTGERPYSCDLCPLRFGHASNLARHRRLHSGEKPFECTDCGKKFSRKDKLGVHAARKCCTKRRRITEGQDSGVKGESS